jgi:hypothetical protein
MMEIMEKGTFAKKIKFEKYLSVCLSLGRMWMVANQTNAHRHARD